MKIICLEHYEKVVHYAERIGDTTLRKCLERLEALERNLRCPCEIELYYDLAPYSFLFRQRYADGTLGVVGGLVYHGTPDRSGCYAEPRIHGWAIHT